MNTLEDAQLYFQSKGYVSQIYPPFEKFGETEPKLMLMGRRRPSGLGHGIFAYRSGMFLIAMVDGWKIQRPNYPVISGLNSLIEAVALVEDLLGPPIEDETEN